MPIITVITRDGESHQVEGSPDLSVMEVVRDAGFDELLAMCGGCCSCATCHVFVEEGGADLPSLSADEEDLLDSSENRSNLSRLSCQLPMREVGDGLIIRIAPEE